MTRVAGTRDSMTSIFTTLVPSAAGCAVCFRSRVRKRTRADREQCQKLPKTFRACQISCSADRNCRWTKRCGRGSSASAERDLSFREFGNVSPVHGQAARDRLNSVVRGALRAPGTIRTYPQQMAKADVEGRQLGQLVADRAWVKANAYFNGNPTASPASSSSKTF